MKGYTKVSMNGLVLEIIKGRQETMRVLMISDQLERKSFCQIESLKDALQNKTQQKIDLFVFSKESFLFNGQKTKEIDVFQTLKKLESIIDSGRYSLYVVSLEKLNIEKLFFSSSENILLKISKNLDEVTMMIFAAQSVLNRIKELPIDQKINLFFFPRRGVSKTSKQFTKQILKML